MLSSMTGFGRSSLAEGDLHILVEIRTLNHRYMEVNVRIPPLYSSLEPHIRGILKETIFRGKVEVWVTVKDRRERPIRLRLNNSLVKGIVVASDELKETHGVEGKLEVRDILTFRDVLSIEEEEVEGHECVSMLVDKCLRKALEGAVKMRVEEGQALSSEMKKGIRKLKSLRQKVNSLMNTHKLEMADRVNERIREMLVMAKDEGYLEEKLAVEVALLADKLDVSEEMERIESHLSQFLKTVRGKERTKGRKLDFIIQELNREFNTIGSKTQSGEISRMVIEAKAQMEKLREQVQNIE